MGALKAIEYYTYNDYIHWEGEWELIGGTAYAMSPSPYISHQALGSGMVTELHISTDDCKNCLVVHEEDYKINEYTILKPDVALICNEQNKKHITKAPLIVVEVISPSTARRDEEVKFKIYEEEKVSYVVFVYPEDLIAKIYKLKDDKYSKEGDFSIETYEFKELECPAKINFARVFKKFRD
jgi:Uma2 family endonuclease